MAIHVSSANNMGSSTLVGSLIVNTGMKVEDHMHIAGDFVSQPGIVTSTDLAVTQNGTPNMSVNVAAGTGYILNGSWANNSVSQTRFWRFINDATVNATIAASHPTLNRIDLVAAKFDTGATPNDDATNVVTIISSGVDSSLAGTPGASPSAPALPSNYMLIAQVYVAAGVTTIVNADVTDRRVLAGIGGAAFTDGWIPAGETWTRTGNFTFTVTGDQTSKYRKGARVRYKDGGSFEYGTVLSSAFGAVTTVTLFTNTNYTMAAATITENSVSYSQNPVGYPQMFDWTPTHSRGAVNYTNLPTTNYAKFAVSNSVVWFEEAHTQAGTPGGSGQQLFTLPSTPARLTMGSGGNNATGASMGCFIQTTGAASLFLYDATTPATASQQYLASGAYEF